jgi:hypothetical protein
VKSILLALRALGLRLGVAVAFDGDPRGGGTDRGPGLNAGDRLPPSTIAAAQRPAVVHWAHRETWLHHKNQDDRGKGSTFWLMLKKFVGSYLVLSSTSRW